MWKEKLYSGTLSSYSSTTRAIMLPGTSTATVNIYKTDILNTCIKNFLTECGVSDVVYYPLEDSSDSRKGNLFIYGTPFQFWVINTNTYFTVRSGSFAIVSGSASTTVIFDSSGNYNIRICLAGNPASSFGISIGATTYGGTTYSMPYLMIYKVKSAVDNSYWTLIQRIDSSTSNLWLTKSDGTRPYNAALITSLNDQSNSNIVSGIMNIYPNKYPLIPKYYSFFRLLDCYEVVSFRTLGLSVTSSPETSYFLEIGNKTYFYTSSYHFILIDCG